MQGVRAQLADVRPEFSPVMIALLTLVSVKTSPRTATCGHPAVIPMKLRNRTSKTREQQQRRRQPGLVCSSASSGTGMLTAARTFGGGFLRFLRLRPLNCSSSTTRLGNCIPHPPPQVKDSLHPNAAQHNTCKTSALLQLLQTTKCRNARVLKENHLIGPLRQC